MKRKLFMEIVRVNVCETLCVLAEFSPKERAL